LIFTYLLFICPTGAGPGRSKKAPLMAKTLQFMRGRHKR